MYFSRILLEEREIFLEMSLPAEKQALLTQLLAEAESAKNAKPAAIAAREAAIAEKKKAADLARMSAHFEELGLGEIPVEQQDNFEFFLKHLENMNSVFDEARQQSNSKWFKDKTTEKLFSKCEDSFRGLVDRGVRIISFSNLGGHKEAATAKIAQIQDDSNKRKRMDEEKDRPLRQGCTCGKHDPSINSKCGARCPCRKEGIPCSDNCRCTAENCQNPSGLPPPRPERRGRPPVQVPQVREFDMEPTQRFPTNRRTTTSERSYKDDDEDDWERYRQPRTKQTARQATHTHARTHTHTHAQAPPFPLFGKGFSSDITGDGPTMVFCLF